MAESIIQKLQTLNSGVEQQVAVVKIEGNDYNIVLKGEQIQLLLMIQR